MELSHNALEGAVKAHPRSIIPRIPPEVLTQIVEWLMPEDDDWYKFPWPYTQVCRYWRHVLVAVPHLWNNITIGDRDSHPGQQEYQHRSEHPRVSLQLERTGIIPLFIDTRHESFYDPDVLELLALHHSRWKEAKLRFYRSDVEQLSSARKSWSFDRLRVLVFRLNDKVEANPLSSFTYPNVFLDAPKLEFLCLSRVPLQSLNFPWPQLTNLSLHRVHTSADHIWKVLTQCTSLYELKLAISFNEDGTSPSTSIALPSLRDLRYYPLDEDRPRELLRHLRMPSLRYLKVRNTLVQEIRSCFSLSQPPLLSFHLEVSDSWIDQTADIDAIAEILGMVPSIQHFSIQPYRTQEPRLDIILTLLNYEGEYQLCPNLMSLMLLQAPFSNESAELFIQMLASRSIVNIHKKGAIIKTLQDKLDNLTEPFTEPDELRSFLQDAKARMRKLGKGLLGLTAVLRQLSITFEEKAKEDYFSDAQLSTIQELTENITLKM